MSPLLELIQSPDDLKHFSISELSELAKEIRARIIEVVSKTGGHLASNLGIVELTIALHKVFDSPRDKFIFDTSHQTYPHKILTGRNALFETLRQTGGLSGFCHPPESPHDHFYAGHAGTGLSLALGNAKSRDLSGEEYHVCPVLGDAAFSCGLTFEALNNVPKTLKNFIIILNDNGMAIAKNVGAITQILPQAKEFFKQYGLAFKGPINGHSIEELTSTLSSIKNLDHPVVLHVKTVKGQGMENAVSAPTTYHGAKPFDKETGIFHPKKPTKDSFPKVFGKHILHMAEQDEKIIALTPAMPAGSSLTNMMEKFPDRCLDVGIAEGHCVTFAGALAKNPNLKVVACIYSTFMQRALDNLFHDVCLQKAPVVFCLDRGGIAGGDGPTHNGIYDIGFLKAMPEIVIAQPRNGTVLKELLDDAFSWKKTTVIRYPNLPVQEDAAPQTKRVPGKAEILAQGKDIAIVALGHQVYTALAVRDILLQEEIHVTVIDPVFVKPLDEELFLSVFETHKTLVTIEEHSVESGLGSILSHFLMRSNLHDVKAQHFGVPEVFVEQGKHADLLSEIGLNAENIASKILTTCMVNQ